jgi:serine phosphatase RsbU (regulator of sigma subunit)/anti-sigma regulatory factor (Ser/Thr protein kinase)
VTEAERMSAELLDAERMLTAMLDAVDEGFVVQAADGDMLALNKRARELLGPLGAVRDRLPPGWRLLDSGGLPISATAGPTRVVLATDRPLSGRIKVQRSDGSIAWLAVECRPLHRSGEAAPFAALASFADVTAQAEAGEERRALEEEQERRRRAEDMAERLRSIFAPSSPPPTPGIKLTGVYVPAAEGMSGDWHEAIALPDGTLGLAIGDVTGHGIDAAAQMGTLRAALHAYALELHEPNLVLERLNLILRRSGARMASVLYAILDADQGILRFASAGHPPILLLSPSGEVSFLRAARSPLLGYDYGEDRVQAVVALEPGSTLLLYTDGVLEGGSKSVDDALAKLADRVREAAGFDLEELCAHVLPSNGDGPREDDAALFACRIDGIAEPELQLQFDADPSQLRILRHALGRWLDRLEMGQDDRFQLLLAVDEAARNAIEHAYGLEAGSFAVHAAHTGSEITIRVSDAGRWRPARGRRRGRGISLMRKLVNEMEIQDLHPGTEVTLVRKLKRVGSA